MCIYNTVVRSDVYRENIPDLTGIFSSVGPIQTANGEHVLTAFSYVRWRCRGETSGILNKSDDDDDKIATTDAGNDDDDDDDGPRRSGAGDPRRRSSGRKLLRYGLLAALRFERRGAVVVVAVRDGVGGACARNDTDNKYRDARVPMGAVVTRRRRVAGSVSAARTLVDVSPARH